MDYAEAVAYLDRHIGLGVKPGLERITAFLDLMGNPQRSYPIIHITGSNGKTSTARFIAALAQAHGLRTGAFTSPHLERVEERLALDGQYATRDQFAEAVGEVAAFADLFVDRAGAELTYFELTAALAFSWFAGQAVDLGVMEVGLGGRLDATNAADGAVAVLTGVSLEHTEYLGNTVEEVAEEKLAITKPDSVLVTGPLSSEVLPLASRTAARLGIPHHHFGRDFRIDTADLAVGGWRLEIEGVFASYPNLFLPLHGRHQTRNFAVAIASFECLLGRRLNPQAVAEGSAVSSSPGRMEVVSHRPLVMLDGAHNVEGFSVLGAALAEEFPTIEWVLILGAMSDKPLEQMVAAVAPHLSHVVATSVDSPRAIEPPALADRIRDVVDVPVGVAPDVSQAVDTAMELAAAEGAILVAGSLYLVGAARALLAGRGSPHRGER